MIFINEVEEEYGISEPVKELPEPFFWEKNKSMLPEELEKYEKSNYIGGKKSNNKIFTMTNYHRKKETYSCPFFGYPIEVDCSIGCSQYDDCMRYLEDN